jgi:uncharacterized repeat protein (TIGR01451 family)
MPQNIKSSLKVSLALTLAIAGVLSVVLTGRYLSPQPAAAQEPTSTETPALPLDPETLAALGLSAQDIQAAGVFSYDLEIAKTAAFTSVAAGSPMTYTIVITNRGPDTILGFSFKDYLPAEMQNAKFFFSTSTVMSSGETIPLWIIFQTLNPNDTSIITVTGILTSPYSKAVSNRADVIPFAQGEITSTNNSSQVSVNVGGVSSLYFIHLPLIRKDPIPEKILAYFEDFYSSNTWPEYTYNGCTTDKTNTNYQYWVTLQGGYSACLPAAPDDNKPEKPHRAYGEFEVTAYDSGEQQDADNEYGLFINGAGGDEYYFFAIQPNKSGCSNGGAWRLRHVIKNNTDVTLASGTCHTAIVRGYGSTYTNTLKIRRKDTSLSVYVNNTAVTTVTDTLPSQYNITTGLYVDSDDKQVKIKFDNFTVYKFP